MTKTQRNFVAGRMNKSIDERLLQNGEYVDAQNVRIGSTENSEIGSVENAKGNIEMTPSISFPLPGETYSTALSPFAVCIGKYADEANETIYWFVHDPSWMGPYPDGAPLGATIVTGTNTAVSPNELVDAGASFESDGTVVGAIVVEDADPNNFAYVTTITDDNTLGLSRDVFTATPTAYTIYQNTHRMDMILSYNVNSQNLIYHIVSVYNCIPCDTQWSTTLNFNPNNLITGVNLIDNLLFFTDNNNAPRVIDITKQYQAPTVNPPVPPQLNATTSCDNFTSKEIMVIKEPPTTSPNITFGSVENERNYIEDRMLSFATRYRYEGGEYSALSSFSEIAFSPETFFFGKDTNLNDGMINQYNVVNVEFETGSDLVTDIEVVFKNADTSLIHIIDRFNKNQLGINNNSTYSIAFDNSKIYTVLPEYEILRLYDNVPIVAKAQTIMGNRLMYGNYEEQYDLVNKFDAPVNPIYNTTLDSKSLGFQPVTATLGPRNHTTYSYVINNIPDNEVELDFGDIPLTVGSVVNISFEIEQANPQWTWDNGAGPFDTYLNPVGVALPANSPLSSGNSVSFTFTLPQDYTDATQMFNSIAFQQALGSGIALNGGIAQAYWACYAVNNNGQYNLTNFVHCTYTTGLTDVGGNVRLKYLGGSGTPNTDPGAAPTQTMPIGSDAMTGAGDESKFKLWLNPMVYIPQDAGGGYGSPTGPSGITSNLLVVPKLNNVVVSVTDASDNRSLHSNRGYEVGIIYMDDWNRATTPITSNKITAIEGGGDSGSSIFVPCYMSDRVNKARVTIPPPMAAPKWATNFKFAMKPTAEGYETIYVTTAFTTENATNLSNAEPTTYFLLEGENAQKVEVGDKLIVKSDANGAVFSCEYATVLEKNVQPEGFLTIPDPNNNANNLFVPAGVYMELANFPFAITSNLASTYPVAGIPINQTAVVSTILPDGQQVPNICPELQYEGLSGTPIAGIYNMPIPVGAVVRIVFKVSRKGVIGGTGPGGSLLWKFRKMFKVAQTYSDIIAFWNDMDVATLMQNEGVLVFSACNSGYNVTYSPVVVNNPANAFYNFPPNDCDANECGIFLQWFQDAATNEIKLLIRAGGGESESIKIICSFKIVEPKRYITFETPATPANPDLWYEGSDVYPIDVATGSHQGLAINNDIDQVVGTALGGTTGVFNLSFFNCFTFGNGIESYKINDSLAGRYFLLGQRVTSTANEEYKRANRYADITYSGIINDETNINKSNEFNLGLINYKSLEDSFGKIQILSGRETDVLVLQEDKISYVLAGKNLLSDSSGGGTIASVPEVLGTQIARTERFGISNNPESYVEYGVDKFFIDEKRGAVLNLRGSSGQNEQLQILSEYGMRSWFRDAFNGELTSDINVYTQKLGGFDPYMNEYVVSLTDKSLFYTPGPCDVTLNEEGETEQDIVDCGTDTTITTDGTLSPIVLYVNFPLDGESSVGLIQWPFTFGAGGSAFVQVDFGDPLAVVYGPTLLSDAGNNLPANLVQWNKDTPIPTQCTVTITPNVATEFTVSVPLNCPEPPTIDVETIVYTSQRNCPSGNTSTYYDPPNVNATCLHQWTMTWQWQATDLTSGAVNQQIIEHEQAEVSSQTPDIYQTIVGTPTLPQYPYIPDCQGSNPCNTPPNGGNGWNDSQWQALPQGSFNGAPSPTDLVTVELDVVDLTDFTTANDFYFDVTKHSLRYLRSNTNYDRAVQNDAVLLLAETYNAANPNSGAMALESWNETTLTWDSPAVSGALRYRGTFTMPAPIAPNTDPNLYLVADTRDREPVLLCHTAGANGSSTLIDDVCCDCSCGAGNYTCYQLKATQAEYYWGFVVTTPASAPATEVVFIPPYDSAETGSCITVCSSTYPQLQPGSLLPETMLPPVNPADIVIQSCGDAAGCTDCGTADPCP